MRKLLICCAMSASLLTAGCGTVDTVKGWGTVVGDAIPNIFNGMPLMYRQDIQQGNIVTQEMINKLHPGMARRQVKYIMGTPILIDVFHQDRWDYYYSMRKGGNTPIQERVSLYFQDNKLTKIEGDYRPLPTSSILEKEKEVVVQVPDYEAQEKGFFSRTLEKIGLVEDDN